MITPKFQSQKVDKVYKNLVVMIGAESCEEMVVGQHMAELVTTYCGSGDGLQVVNTDKVGVDQGYHPWTTDIEANYMLLVGHSVLRGEFWWLIYIHTHFSKFGRKITGIVVIHAEKVVAISVEAFILRIFRQKNRNGFIKAFSDVPEPFTTGFSPLTNVLKNLFLRTLLLWPWYPPTPF
jgi:DNA excision repair protein ERCC-4